MRVYYGVSPYKYMLGMRLEQVKDLLLYSTSPIAEISEQCGFSDPLYFSRQFSKNTVFSPTVWRGYNTKK